MLSVCAATVLAASMLAGGAVQALAAPAQPADAAAPAVVTEENCISGSWKRASDPTVTAKVRKVFEKALTLVGASYTPAAVLATRTTAKNPVPGAVQDDGLLSGRTGAVCGGHPAARPAGQGGDPERR